MADHSKTRLALCLFLAGLAAPAFAQDSTEKPAEKPAEQAQTRTPMQPGVAGGHSQAAFIASYDSNGDGKVDMDEFITVRTARFTGADKDGDGQLNEAEYVAEFEGRLRQQYAEQGRDTADEGFANGLKQAGVRFALLDRDRNGFLSLEEDLESGRKTFTRNDTNEDGIVDASDPAPKREGDGGQNAASPAGTNGATTSN